MTRERASDDPEAAWHRWVWWLGAQSCFVCMWLVSEVMSSAAAVKKILSQGEA